jgi:hypothetical protein
VKKKPVDYTITYSKYLYEVMSGMTIKYVVSAFFRGINDKHHLRVEVLYYYQINNILIYNTEIIV